MYATTTGMQKAYRDEKLRKSAEMVKGQWSMNGNKLKTARRTT